VTSSMKYYYVYGKRYDWIKPSLREAAEEWYCNNKKILDSMAIKQENCLIVRYERLYSSNLEELKRIGDFLGKDYYSCFKNRDLLDSLINTFKPIGMDTWQKALPDLNDYIPKHVKNLMEYMGYLI